MDLAQIQLFAQLDDEARALLAGAMRERILGAHETLFATGDVGDSMFFVRSGEVELFVEDTTGKKVVLRTVGPGAYFGELSLLDGGARTASAVASEPSRLYVLEREGLEDLFRTHPDAALAMLAATGPMIRRANALVRERVARNVNEADCERASAVVRAADWVANFSGSITFLALHVVFFAAWIALNTDLLPVGGFDPYPYGLLTMAVSLEAIILSTLLLFSQNRQSSRDRIRGEIEYEVNLKAELEIAHLHHKTERMHEDVLARLARIEKALEPAPAITRADRSAVR